MATSSTTNVPSYSQLVHPNFIKGSQIIRKIELFTYKDFDGIIVHYYRTCLLHTTSRNLVSEMITESLSTKKVKKPNIPKLSNKKKEPSCKAIRENQCVPLLSI